MLDCFEALKALPRREHRKLVQRIKARKSLTGIVRDNGESDPALENALKEKYPDNIYTPSALLPHFDMEDLMENEILQYLIFDDSVKSEKNRMEMIVREFCPPLSNKNPARIEKLLNVMNFKEAMKLYIILPAGLMTSEDLSSHSKIKPFILDFIEDARDLIKMEKKDILQILLEH